MLLVCAEAVDLKFSRAVTAAEKDRKFYRVGTVAGEAPSVGLLLLPKDSWSSNRWFRQNALVFWTHVARGSEAAGRSHAGREKIKRPLSGPFMVSDCDRLTGTPAKFQ